MVVVVVFGTLGKRAPHSWAGTRSMDAGGPRRPALFGGNAFRGCGRARASRTLGWERVPWMWAGIVLLYAALCCCVLLCAVMCCAVLC